MFTASLEAALLMDLILNIRSVLLTVTCSVSPRRSEKSATQLQNLYHHDHNETSLFIVTRRTLLHRLSECGSTSLRVVVVSQIRHKPTNNQVHQGTTIGRKAGGGIFCLLPCPLSGKELLASPLDC